MASPTLRQILEDTRRLVKQSQATAKQGAITGQSPDSLPGSEHDKPVPAECKTPDKEVPEGQFPASGAKTTGAGDDSEITRGHALEADESAKTPAKKPLLSDDANAKTAEGAAGLANELLALIRGHQKAAAPAAKVEDKTAAAPAAKVEDKTAAAPAAKVEDKTAAAPAPKKSEQEAAKSPDPASAGQKCADGLNMELTSDVLSKIAALVMHTEEGAELVERVLAKEAGKEAAQEAMSFLAAQSELAEKQAAFEQGQADADALVAQQIYAQGVTDGQKSAGANPSNFWFKMGQDAAGASIADLMGGAPGGDMGGGAVPPEAMGAAPGGEMGAAPGGEMGGDPAAGGDITMEDMVAALDSLVQDGTLQPEEAQQVIAQLTGGEGGGAGAPEAAPGGEAAAVGGEAGGEAAGGEAAGGEAAPVEEPKEAAAKPAAKTAAPQQEKAAKLLEVIKSLRAQK